MAWLVKWNLQMSWWMLHNKAVLGVLMIAALLWTVVAVWRNGK